MSQPLHMIHLRWSFVNKAPHPAVVEAAESIMENLCIAAARGEENYTHSFHKHETPAYVDAVRCELISRGVQVSRHDRGYTLELFGWADDD